MARLHVIDSAGGRMPFLRGILTRSLLAAGLEFETAYEIASSVRAGLASRQEVTVDDVRRAVEKHLRRSHATQLARYRAALAGGPQIVVRLPEGQDVPYSRGRHRQSLEACGIEAEAAGVVSQALYQALLDEGLGEVEPRDIQWRTWKHLRRHHGDEAARRYLAWEEYRHGDRPLVLLLGGTTGTGKSTVATRTAHVLDVVRTQSTDMLREVMRMMLPERLVPVLHRSSFRAWETLHVAGPEPSDDALVEGYMRQAELLSVAGEAVVRRAEVERVSVIVEGVHVHPTFLPRSGTEGDAVVVRAMLAVLSRKELERRLRGRGKRARARRAARYLRHFDEIWRLQSHLLSEADRHEVPIVVNEDLEGASREIVEAVIQALLRDFDATPEQVFG